MHFRKHPLAFAVLLALGSQPGLAQTSPAAKALLQQGLYWQAQAQPARAAEAWKKLLRLQPDEPRALYGLAHGELAQKRSAGAAEILVRLRALDAQGRWATQLAQDITLGSGDAPKALDQARLLHESGDIEKSVEQYQRALGGSEPVGDVGLEYYRVFSKLPTGWKAARAGFERLAKDNPNDPQIELHLAFHLARGEEPRWDTRIEGIQRLGRVSLVPSVSGFAIECWKMALSWPSTKPEMLALFDTYLKLHPDDSEVAELRAGAVKKLATLAKAGEPGQVQPQIAAGLKALGQGDLALAESQYLARLKTHAKDPDALGGLGLVRMQQNRLEESAALLTQATQQKNGQNWAKALQSTRYQLLIEQATSAQREGDLAQARNLLQQAIKLDPRLDGAMLALAALQAQAGEADAAERGFRQVLARNADEPAALRGLAGLLAASDRPDEARRLIDGLKPAQVGGVDEMNRLRATLASGQAKAALRRG
ncbi:MAG: cellulose synthase, partial [Betaproteobacteria bacterium]|nr:cellulose synthase [Betaproteobacteria bacterium]